MENSMEIPQKTRARTAILSSDTAPGHFPREVVVHIHHGVTQPQGMTCGLKANEFNQRTSWLGEFSQDQKHKRHMFSLIWGRQIQR
jgi:hypothetical protein